MIFIKRLLQALLMMSLFVPIAAASEFPDTDGIDAHYFTDWLTLSDLLRLKGIDVITINWNAIEMACLPLKTENDQTVYNRCKYEKANLSQEYTVDNNYCVKQAQVQSQYWIDPFVVQDVADVEDTVFSGCMLSLGWANPHNWIAGRRVPPAPPM